MKYAPDVIVIRGAGDLATGVIQKLWRAGFKVAALELDRPLTIRRTVALSSAMHYGSYTVEGMTARRVNLAAQCPNAWSAGEIPLLADPGAACLRELRPVAVVDAILAKRNLGLCKDMAPLTIALGPGFSAPQDADAVVETMRGHSLGSLITSGTARHNTGIPGELGGHGADRVVYAPLAGRVKLLCAIGDRVSKGENLFTIDGVPVSSPLSGLLRGLIADNLRVPQGLKCADVDPRPASDVDWLTISDKARSLGGAVLEACFWLAHGKGVRLSPSPPICSKNRSAQIWLSLPEANVNHCHSLGYCNHENQRRNPGSRAFAPDGHPGKPRPEQAAAALPGPPVAGAGSATGSLF